MTSRLLQVVAVILVCMGFTLLGHQLGWTKDRAHGCVLVGSGYDMDTSERFDAHACPDGVVVMVPRAAGLPI
jgi:hypothetical protein